MNFCGESIETIAVSEDCSASEDPKSLARRNLAKEFVIIGKINGPYCDQNSHKELILRFLSATFPKFSSENFTNYYICICICINKKCKFTQI